jgi:aspartyl-tRNA(Asn)/glutamyl-tRNA(Gln) amidotransferase subunit C
VKISEDTVKYVANLARLNLDESETAEMTKHLGNILDYMDSLNNLDTMNVRPMEHVEHISNVFRDDIVVESYDVDDILANAPDSDDGAFKVPKIV